MELKEVQDKLPPCLSNIVVEYITWYKYIFFCLDFLDNVDERELTNRYFCSFDPSNVVFYSNNANLEDEVGYIFKYLKNEEHEILYNKILIVDDMSACNYYPDDYIKLTLILKKYSFCHFAKIVPEIHVRKHAQRCITKIHEQIIKFKFK